MTPNLDPESGAGAGLCGPLGGLSFPQARAAAIGGVFGADPARGAESSPPGASRDPAQEKAGQGGARGVLYGKIAAGGDYGQAA